MFCGKCGKEIENDAAVCKWCGSPTGIEQNCQSEYKKTVEAPQKTAFGVSLGVLAAGSYWLGMASELAALLLIAYIFLKEEKRLSCINAFSTKILNPYRMKFNRVRMVK